MRHESKPIREAVVESARGGRARVGERVECYAMLQQICELRSNRFIATNRVDRRGKQTAPRRLACRSGATQPSRAH